MDRKDSPSCRTAAQVRALAVDAHWLTTVLEDRAESAPPPAPTDREGER